MNRVWVRIPVGRSAAMALFVLFSCHLSAFGQGRVTNPYSGATPGPVPWVNVGGGAVDAQFGAMDLAQIMLLQQNKTTSPQDRDRQKKLVDSGTVSALDLAAPPKA